MGFGQVITMPLFFASNALYPIDVMPTWLQVVSRINPLSYLVDALRGLLVGTPAHVVVDLRCSPAPPRWGSWWPARCWVAWSADPDFAVRPHGRGDLASAGPTARACSSCAHPTARARAPAPPRRPPAWRRTARTAVEQQLRA